MFGSTITGNIMYKCVKCGAEWETNYCPTCNCTIDSSFLEAEQKAEAAAMPTTTRRIAKSRETPSKNSSSVKDRHKKNHGLRISLILALISYAIGIFIGRDTIVATFKAGNPLWIIFNIVDEGLNPICILSLISALIFLIRAKIRK